ncbi:NADPH-dependent F420 reductase [Streptomyces sp. NPDC087856]|uniref:NADPH-dependent F420 reductase n=1 Tax=Streptomyces sp. NPDC087856 TaxID=3365811 RepID=UPI0038146ECF
MAKTLGLIGSGIIATALARRALDAGYDVVLSNSRGPETLSDLVAELGKGARAATPAEAARAGDIVVAAVPLHAYVQLPRPELDGKIVIDVMNYVPSRDGNIPELDTNELTSTGLLQRQLPESKVVKVFNSIPDRHLLALARTADAPDRSALPLAGNTSDAKKQVADLLNSFGFDAVDIGDLSESWRFEPNTPLYALVYAGQLPSGLSPLELYGWFMEAAPVPAPAELIQKLATVTERGPAGLSL